jgi:hypothetical protein
LRHDRRLTASSALVLATLLTGLLAVTSHGQPTTLQVTHSYPTMLSNAVDYDDGDPNLAFTGMGGTVVANFVVNENDPHPWNNSDSPPAGSSDSTVRTLGFVYDVKRVSNPSASLDKIFVAAGKAGILRFSRTPSIGTDPDYGVQPFQQPNDLAYVLDVVDIAGVRFIVLGTRTILDTSGAVYVLEEVSGPATLRGWQILGAPVLGIAASYNAASGNVMLLVGTACQGLRRYDFSTTGQSPTWPPIGAGSLGQPTAQYPNLSSCPNPPCGPIWRDIAIDAINQRAYVSAFKDGLFAFDLTTGLSVVSGWPYLQPNTYVHRLDFEPVGGYLVATLGPAYSKERQHLGICEKPVPCYSSDPLDDADASASGLRLFQPMTSGAQPVGEWSGAVVKDFLVRDVAIRRVSSTSYRFYLASGTRGFEIVTGANTGGGWTLQLAGAYGDSDADKVAPGSMDDLVFNADRSVLYGGTEGKLVAFDTTVGMGLLLDDVTDVESSAGAVFVEHVLHGGYELVLGKGQDFVSVFDAATRLNPVFTHSIDAKGRGLLFQVVNNGLNPSGDPWVYWVNYNLDVDLAGTPWDTNGTVRAVRLTGPAPCASGCEMARWLDTSSQPYPPGGPLLRRLDGIAVRGDLSGEHAIYVNFSPRDSSYPNLGLLILKAVWNPVRRLADVSLEAVVVAQTNVPTAPAGGVTWDASANRVYAAYGCNGIAMYELSGAYSAAPSYRPLSGVPIHIAPATIGSDKYVYVSTLNSGIALIKASTSSDFINSTPIWLVTPHQSNMVLVDPSNPLLLHIADGGGGVHRAVGQ